MLLLKASRAGSPVRPLLLRSKLCKPGRCLLGALSDSHVDDEFLITTVTMKTRVSQIPSPILSVPQGNGLPSEH